MIEKCTLSAWSKGCTPSCAKHERADGTCSCCCPMLGFSMLFISAVCIGIGLLTIIGANWGNIPNFIKVIFYLALLSVNIYWLVKASATNRDRLKEGLLPNTERNTKLVLSLPMFAEITKEEQQTVAKTLIECVELTKNKAAV